MMNRKVYVRYAEHQYWLIDSVQNTITDGVTIEERIEPQRSNT